MRRLGNVVVLGLLAIACGPNHAPAPSPKSGSSAESLPVHSSGLSKDEKKDAVEPEAKSEATGKLDVTGKPDATVQVHADGETTSTKAREWWCTCNYPEDARSKTFCFTGEHACHEKIREGGSSFEDAECFELGAITHPKELLSGDGWAETRQGVIENPDCAFEDAPLERAAEKKALADENFSGIKLGMSAKKIVAALGQPSKKEYEEEAATGKHLQFWNYPDKKILVIVSGRGSNLVVDSMSLQGPGLKTARGVEVGDDYAKAREAYADALTAPIHFDEEDRFLVGSLYFGMMVKSEAGSVSSIFWGSMAE